MKNRISLQWQLTILTAILVIVSCVTLSFVISKSALLYMDEIKDSVVAVFPEDAFTDGVTGEANLSLDITGNLSGQIQNTQTEFWIRSLLVTLCITIISSTLIYFVVGYALRPLKELDRQVREIQEKNMNQQISVNHGAREIRELTGNFNGMLKRLSDAFFVQRQFSANAAHELRTPLAVMQTKLEVLERKEQISEAEYHEAFEMLTAQTNRLSHVIDVLLQMTELNTAKKEDEISLAALTEEVLCDLEAFGEEREVELIQKPGDAVILGNDTLVYRAVYNLVENAIKYNHPGGRVAVEIVNADSCAQVQISDTGDGISAADREKIFEPFFRVDKSRSRAMGGAGLGLSLVREIAELHGGEVRVLQSSPAGSDIAISFRR